VDATDVPASGKFRISNSADCRHWPLLSPDCWPGGKHNAGHAARAPSYRVILSMSLLPVLVTSCTSSFIGITVLRAITCPSIANIATAGRNNNRFCRLLLATAETVMSAIHVAPWCAKAWRQPPSRQVVAFCGNAAFERTANCQFHIQTTDSVPSYQLDDES
jgi:hypothetical protein